MGIQTEGIKKIEPSGIKVKDIIFNQGYISITRELLESLTIENFQKLFDKVIFLKCEHSFYPDSFKILAVSPHFQKLDHEVIPEYLACLENNDKGEIIKVKWNQL